MSVESTGKGDELRRLIQNESSAASAEERGLVSRAPRRILAPRTIGDVRDRLGGTVAALFGPAVGFQLFVAGPGQDLVPARAADASADLRALQLLAMLRGRVAGARGALDQGHSFTADQLPGRRAIMSAPVLGGRGELLGLVIVEAGLDRDAFTSRELVVLEGAAALAGGVLQRLEGEGGPGSRARIDLDRRAAHQIQRNFLSSTLPEGAGVTASAEYLPALDVGGDFYVVKHLDDGTVCAAIGDVSGNGVSAALLMSRVASDFERAIASGASPSQVLTQVHGGLEQLDTDRFVTAACVRIDPQRGRLVVANAGHLPIVARRRDGEVHTFGGATTTPLGITPCDCAEEGLVVQRGDVFVLATDGLLEALDPPTGHRGLELLEDLARSAPHEPKRISARIRDTVDAVRRTQALDDVTWLVLQVAP